MVNGARIVVGAGAACSATAEDVEGAAGAAVAVDVAVDVPEDAAAFFGAAFLGAGSGSASLGAWGL
jgi:hypothetical protein